MNKIDDIVIDINKDKKKVSEEKQQPINKKTSIYKYDIHNWILLLREKMSKKGYKKAIKDIISAGLIEQFKGTDLGYKITILFIQANIKIIENKIFKYHIIQSDKLKHQINRCFHYAKLIPYRLDSLLENIPKHLMRQNNYYYDVEKRNLSIQYVDDVVRCYFDYIYVMALFHFKLNNCLKSATYLSFGCQLAKIAKYYILSSHTLFKAEKCFILLAKLLITDEDYDNALIILNEAIKICFKQIVFQVKDIYMGFFIGERKDIKVIDKTDLEKLKDSRMKRVILNIVIIFFYIGICHENMSNIKKATAFYKQCEWFSRIFLVKDNKVLYKFFFRLKKNSIEVCNIIDFLQEKIIEVDKKLQKKMEEALKDEMKKKHGKDNLTYDRKFKKLVEKLDKMKIREIDTVNKKEKDEMLRNLSSSNKKTRDKYIFLSNMRLLEAYLTKDFRGIVSNMKKINLFDLDTMTRAKIQRIMDNMKIEEEPPKIKLGRIHLSPKLKNNKNMSLKRLSFKDDKKENEKSNKDIIKNYSKEMEPRPDKKKKLTLNLTTNKILQNQIKTPYTRNQKSDKSLFIFSKDSMVNSPRERKSISSSNIFSNSPLPNKKKINIDFDTKTIMNKTFAEKIKMTPQKSFFKKKPKLNLLSFEQPTPKGHYFLNFRYLKKRNYIKKLSDREINFQKSLIKTKKTPMPQIRYFNKGLSLNEADSSFEKIQSLVSNVMVNSDWKDNMSENEFRDYLMKIKLENTFLSSLNNRALEKYKIMINQKEKENFESSRFEKSLKEVDKNNESTLDELTLKLNAIYEVEEKRNREKILKNLEISKQIIKRLYRNKSSKGRNEDKNVRNEGFFIKKMRFSSSVTNFPKFNIK